MKKPFLLFVLLAPAMYTFAQDNKPLMARPVVGMQWQANPTRDLIQWDSSLVALGPQGGPVSTGQYGTNTFQFGGVLPLYSYKKNKLDRELPVIYGVNMNGNFGYQEIVLAGIANSHKTWLLNTQRIYRITMGTSGYYFNGKKNLWLAGASAFVANDQYTIAKPNVHGLGYIHFQRYVTSKFAYHLGMAFSYTFGSGLPLPYGGLSFNIFPKGRLTAQVFPSVLILVPGSNLPFNISYLHRVNKNFNFRIYYRPTGNVAFLTNQFGEFNTRADLVSLRTTEWHTGGNFRWRFKGNWVLAGEIGAADVRRLYISDKSTGTLHNFDYAHIGNNIYYGVGISYRFGKNPDIKNQSSTITLDDVDLQDIDPKDIK